MDAVILAGGFATRLWPITKKRAKPLLPLGEKPIVDYLIEDIQRENRIDKTYLSINKKFRKDFINYLEKNGYKDIDLVIEDSVGEEEKLGALGALYQVIEKKELNGPLLVVAGDNYVSFNVSDFLDFFENKQKTSLAAYEVPLEEASSFGVLEVEGGKVIDFNEKPDNPSSNLISIAFYIFSEEAISKLGDYIEGGENPDAPGYFLQWLIEKENVFAFDFDGTWFDIGTPRGYLEANKTILEGNNVILDSSVNNDSELRNTYLKDSKVKESDLSNCILFEGSEVIDCDLKDVIVDGKKLSEKEIEEELIN